MRKWGKSESGEREGVEGERVRDNGEGERERDRVERLRKSGEGERERERGRMIEWGE